MSDVFAAWLEQVTRPLAEDPELRLQVRREWLRRLEPAAAEYERQGHEPAQARALAVQAQGDPQALAQHLQQIQQPRLRRRRLVRHWALVGLPLLALVVALWPVGGKLWDEWQKREPPPGYQEPFSYKWEINGLAPVMNVFSRDISNEIARLPEDRRFLFYGRPGDKSVEDVARSLAQRWPDNRVYRVFAVQNDFYDTFVHHDLWNAPPLPREQAEPLLASLARCRQLEPDNAYFDYIQAETLLRLSTQIMVGQGPAVKYADQEVGRYAVVKEYRLDRLRVVDPALFAQALEAFRHGLRQPVMETYAREILDLRQRALGPPRTLSQASAYFGSNWYVPVWDVYIFRSLTNHLGAYAMTLAQDGQPDAALTFLAQMQPCAVQMSRKPAFIMMMLMAHGMHMTVAERRRTIFEQLGQLDQAQAEYAPKIWWKQWHDTIDAKEARASFDDYVGRCGTLLKTGTIGPGFYRYNPEPLRSAEYAVFEKLMILVGAGLCALLAGAWSSASLAVVWREHRGVDKTPLIWLGWRPLGWIGLWSLLAPVALYTAYVASPWSGRQWGLSVTWWRVWAEHLALFLLMLVVFLKLTRRALGRRAMALGLTPPPAATNSTPASHGAPRQATHWTQWQMDGSWAREILLAEFVVTFLVLMVRSPAEDDGWFVSWMESTNNWHDVWVGIRVFLPIWIVVALARLLLHRWERKLAPPRVASSLVTLALPPVLALAVIVTAGVGYAGMSWVERAAMRRAVEHDGLSDVTEQVERSSYRQLRDFIIRRNDELNATAAAATPASAPVTIVPAPEKEEGTGIAP